MQTKIQGIESTYMVIDDPWTTSVFNLSKPEEKDTDMPSQFGMMSNPLQDKSPKASKLFLSIFKKAKKVNK